MSKFARQQGGTVLGFIIGLVLGLGIALAVALFVTKSPMPFTSRLARPEKAMPLPPGRPADPNKPLYNDHPPADPIQELLDKREHGAPASSSANQSASPVIELGSPHPDRPKPLPARTAATAPAHAPAAAAAPKPSTADDGKWTYYLQVGAFRDKTEAANLRGKLALIGVDASISERQSESGTLYRVRTGPFAGRDAMNRVRGKLGENKFDAAVVRVARQ